MLKRNCGSKLFRKVLVCALSLSALCIGVSADAELNAAFPGWRYGQAKYTYGGTHYVRWYGEGFFNASGNYSHSAGVVKLSGSGTIIYYDIDYNSDSDVQIYGRLDFPNVYNVIDSTRVTRSSSSVRPS